MIDVEAQHPHRAASSGSRGWFLITVQRNLLSAFGALRLNRLRSLLAMTGVVIGTVAIVTLVAILQGVKTEIKRQVEGLGANLVLVLPSKLDENGQPNPGAILGLSTLTEEDVSALVHVPGVAKVAPVSIVSGAVERAGLPPQSAFVVATNKAGVIMNPTLLAEGRYFEDDEAHVCILADKPRHDLFGNGPALGKIVKARDIAWQVVGVLGKAKGDGTLGSSLLGLNTLVYLPVNTVRKEIPGGQINRIALQTDYKHPAEKMVAQMNAALLRSHGGREDFGIITQEKGLALVIKLLGMAQSLLVLIAAISLFVAGFGIMNIMLATVTERTREIGIRKTVGAKRSDIFLQFLVEAVTLTLSGAGIGLVISTLLCTLIARFSPLTPQITPLLIGVALAVCMVVGVLFGVTPAVRAARLNPIDALRHE